jgi:hypothetical protein
MKADTAQKSDQATIHTKAPTGNVFHESSKGSRKPACSATFYPRATATLSPNDVTIATSQEKQREV